MNLPLIILSGAAGSGKDTIAGFMVKNHGAVAIAQADPMKRFARDAFGFTEEQLWGPSANRNAMDTRFADSRFRNHVLHSKVDDSIGYKWVREVLPNAGPTELGEARHELYTWANQLLNDCETDGGLTPRKMLQTLGTEWGRTVSKNVWVDYAKRVAIELLSGDRGYERTFGLTENEGAAPHYVVITDGRFRNELVSVLAMGGQTWRIDSVTDRRAVDTAGVAGHKSESEMRSIPEHFYTHIFRNIKALGLEAAEKKVAKYMKSPERLHLPLEDQQYFRDQRAER